MKPGGSARSARVSLDAFADARITVDLSPAATIGFLAFEAIQGHDHFGTPPQLRRAIRSRLRQRDLEVLAIFRRRTPPKTLTGSAVAAPIGLAQIVCGNPGAGPRLEDGLEQIAAIDPETFLQASRHCAPQASDTAWSLLNADPRGWLQRYALTLRRAWSEIEPLWSRSTALFDRERERVQAAVARGASADLIASLLPRGTVSHGAWHVPPPDSALARRLTGGAYRLAPSFRIAPVLTGGPATVVFVDGAGQASHLFYPSPDVWRAFAGQLPPPASLDALLGRQRAAILRRLDVAISAGQLAEALQMTPAGVSHHLRSLEAAGLIARTPQGRHVIVTRTARGTGVLALYDEP